jgi:hypothetical protein
MDAAKHMLSKIGIPQSSQSMWQIGIPILLIVLMSIFFSMGTWYKHKYGRYRSTEDSINELLTLRRYKLGSSIDPLAANNQSVCSNLLSKVAPYSQIKENETAMVNWRPLTVRLAGYLGGDVTQRDGVFDMVKGIQLALHLGARSFIFDIDYLEELPCEPVVINRDGGGVMRSLHAAAIVDGIKTLNEMAFSKNYDPVIIVIYLRRLPPGKSQKDTFFKAIAAALDPLSSYHLGSTEQGNFHNCRSESNLFTSPITNFQKKFIILCNYNTNLLPSTSNPKDNLDFWVNARLYLDESGKSSSLGDVTTVVPAGQVPYAQVGDSSQFLMIPDSEKSNFKERSSNTFKIALSTTEYVFSTNEMSTLLNTLGIQCVPFDVIRLGDADCHTSTIIRKSENPDLPALSNATNPNSPLSFWTYAGWSRKNIIEGFTDKVPVSAPIPGFIIPSPVVPKKPHSSMNSNGGLVSIR